SVAPTSPRSGQSSSAELILGLVRPCGRHPPERLGVGQHGEVNPGPAPARLRSPPPAPCLRWATEARPGLNLPPRADCWRQGGRASRTNNNAENAIQRFTSRRRIIGASFTGLILSSAGESSVTGTPALPPS